jgi:hypothetical protein
VGVDPGRLWRVQLALECKAFNSAGRLVEVPIANPDDLATCYAVRYFGGGGELAFADTAPDWFVDRARQHGFERCFSDLWQVTQELRNDERPIEVIQCSTYVFSTPIAEPPGQATLRWDGPEAVIALVDGEPVAGASASRSNDEAAELWVHTEAAHRRRGYGAQVAAAWARAVTDSGKVAFYSHLDHNAESRKLATRLGVTPV